MRKYIVILLYVICLLLIFHYKPRLIFDTNDNIRNFDYENNMHSGTLLSIDIVLTIIALLCFIFILSLELLLFK